MHETTKPPSPVLNFRNSNFVWARLFFFFFSSSFFFENLNYVDTLRVTTPPLYTFFFCVIPLPSFHLFISLNRGFFVCFFFLLFLQKKIDNITLTHLASNYDLAAQTTESLFFF